MRTTVKLIAFLAIISSMAGCFQQIDMVISLSNEKPCLGEVLTFTVTSDPTVTAIIEEAELDGFELDGFQYNVPYSIDTAELSIGKHTLKTRIVSNRLDGGYAIAEFEVLDCDGEKSPPQATIAGESSVTINIGETITFSVVIIDEQDGDLSNSAVWSIVNDNEQGTIGRTFTHTFTEAGTFTVTATATDSDDMSGNDSVEVTVVQSEVTVQITEMPAFGDANGVLRGVVRGINPADANVYPFLQSHEGHWYPKPYFVPNYVPIKADGTFEVDVTTGGYDKCAIAYKVGVYEKGKEPAVNCVPCFNEPLMPDALAVDKVNRALPLRTFSWSGFEWRVKGYEADCPEGPGPNFFDPTDNSVYVDTQGFLHLKIRHNDTRSEWTASEVILNSSLGYGTYWTVIKVSDDLFDAMVVAAFFLWDYFSPIDSFKEQDFEIAIWNQNLDTNAQFVVQPCDACPGCGGNCTRFSIDPGLSYITVFIDWQPGRTEFRIYAGDFGNGVPDEADLIHSWVKTEGIPVPGLEAPHFNFWLLNGQPPSDGQDREMVIKSFHFDPNHLNFTRCGDNTIDPNETCDDGNTTSGDGCSSTCQKEESCGNGVINSGEQCDGTNLNGTTCQSLGYYSGTLTCNTNCQFNTSGCTSTECGDLWIGPGEQCEDGNKSNEDACLNTCHFNVCGDGFRNPAAEGCDDGNLTNGDGCNSSCQVESECGISILSAGNGVASGQVNCYDRLTHGIAVYIRVRGGWWTKPYFAWPITAFNANGIWTCSINTGGVDIEATEVAAFLIPLSYSPPALGGQATLPQALYDNSVDNTTVSIPYPD